MIEMDRRKFYFDDIRLTHRALPEVDWQAIDPSVEFMGKTLSFPLLISSMTGGGNQLFKQINTNLAAAAEAEQAEETDEVLGADPALEAFRKRLEGLL